MPDHRLPRPFFLALICAALLAGCQTTGQTVASPAAVSASEPAGTMSRKGEARNPAGVRTTAIRFNAEEFVGYSPARVLPILGAPDFVRRDGTAQIWQYRATNCILDLFLYTSGNETRVKHAELRPRIPNAEGLDSCYSRMRHERAGQPTS